MQASPSNLGKIPFLLKKRPWYCSRQHGIQNWQRERIYHLHRRTVYLVYGEGTPAKAPLTDLGLGKTPSWMESDFSVQLAMGVRHVANTSVYCSHHRHHSKGLKGSYSLTEWNLYIYICYALCWFLWEDCDIGQSRSLILWGSGTWVQEAQERIYLTVTAWITPRMRDLRRTPWWFISGSEAQSCTRFVTGNEGGGNGVEQGSCGAGQLDEGDLRQQSTKSILK